MSLAGTGGLASLFAVGQQPTMIAASSSAGVVTATATKSAVATSATTATAALPALPSGAGTVPARCAVTFERLADYAFACDVPHLPHQRQLRDAFEFCIVRSDEERSAAAS